MKIPCKHCLLIPICRHKTYSSVVIDCKIMYDMLYEQNDQEFDTIRPDFGKIIKQMSEIIKPVYWKIQLHKENEQTRVISNT